jgi:UDP-2-acetamido-3-amino-2,3-dideoxy-glucuronate N-acetyltransferase
MDENNWGRSFGEVKEAISNGPIMIESCDAKKAWETGWVIYGNNVQVHPGVQFLAPPGTWRGERTYIGTDCEIGAYTIIHAGCKIGKGVRISPHVEMYGGCEIGDNTFIGHGVTLRPRTIIEEHCKIGHSTVFEGETAIGRNVVIGAQCHITKGMRIGEGTFIGPMAIFANDKKMAHLRRDVFPDWYDPPVVGKFVRIGVAAVIMAGVTIHDNAVIGANSLVTKDVPVDAIMVGSPAVKTGEVSSGERLTEC